LFNKQKFFLQFCLLSSAEKFSDCPKNIALPDSGGGLSSLSPPVYAYGRQSYSNNKKGAIFLSVTVQFMTMIRPQLFWPISIFWPPLQHQKVSKKISTGAI